MISQSSYEARRDLRDELIRVSSLPSARQYNHSHTYTIQAHPLKGLFIAGPGVYVDFALAAHPRSCHNPFDAAFVSLLTLEGKDGDEACRPRCYWQDTAATTALT